MTARHLQQLSAACVCVCNIRLWAAATGGRGQAARHQARGGQRRPAMLSGRGPVSYTHLTLPTICSV
eukprot:13125485-Alexandrium_andersonii.AAC.1